MCAAVSASRGRKVLVLDHANKVGKKILMSGGGRCNFTNLYTDPSHFISSNPHFCKSALKRYTPYDFLALVDGYKLEYFEKTLGQYFCLHKSKDLLTILLGECERAKVDIRIHCEISTIEAKTNDSDNPSFSVDTSLGHFSCASLVIATGGLSIPTMGASGFGFEFAKKMGHDIVHTEASLVPFILTDQWSESASSLAGVSLDVEVSCGERSFNEALLFTHRGLSGPAILQISNYWHLGNEIKINFLPGVNFVDIIEKAIDINDQSQLKNLLSSYLPKRFITEFFKKHEALLLKKGKQLDHKDLSAIGSLLHEWTCVPAGTEGYRTAEVTRGGVATDKISSKTFESALVPNLYFIGEVLDVTGWLGGFNFQWAWSSAWCAGQYT